VSAKLRLDVLWSPPRFGTAQPSRRLPAHSADAQPLMASVPGISALKWGPRLVRVTQSALDKISCESLYLFVALLWGLALLLVVPPFQAPDEQSHYLRAWSVSQGQLVANRDATVRVPADVASLPERIGSFVVDWSKNDYSLSEAFRLLDEPISGGQVDAAGSAAAYGPLGYLPQASAMRLVAWLRGSPLLGFYAARLANLLAAILMTYFAIRIAPLGKPLLTVIALFPMTIFLTASVSPDAMTIAGGLFLTSLLLKYSCMERLHKSQLMFLFVLTILLVNVKPGYVALSLLLLLLRPRQFGSKLRYALFVAGTWAAVLAVALVIMKVAPNRQLMIEAQLGAGNLMDGSAQISYVIHHPMAFLRVLFNSLDGGLVFSGKYEALSFLGKSTLGTLGWVTIWLPETALLAIVAAIMMLMAKRESTTITSWQRWVLLSTFVAVTLTICLAMYTQATPLGALSIWGLSGRYFIPCLPALLFAAYGIRLTRQGAVILLILLLLVYVVYSTMRTVLSFYY
jgi:uncharacterized membrane protein